MFGHFFWDMNVKNGEKKLIDKMSKWRSIKKGDLRKRTPSQYVLHKRKSLGQSMSNVTMLTLDSAQWRMCAKAQENVIHIVSKDRIQTEMRQYRRRCTLNYTWEIPSNMV